MDVTSYQVEVLHFQNPQLIWVEVLNTHHSKEHVFEQIGLYGLLPVNQTIDICEEKFKAEKCNKWLPAAATLMKKVFTCAEEVWFSPTFIDRRFSIFDNVHKFGEIIIKKPDGKFKKLSSYLVRSGFALNDEPLFFEVLRNGQLNTKLTQENSEEVVSYLLNYYKQKGKPNEKWVNSIKNQTSVYETSKNIATTLTSINLVKHNKNYTENSNKIEKILQNKMHDLELCKGVDEESIGRGCGIKEKHYTVNRKMQFLKRRVDTLSKKRHVPPKKLNTEEILQNTKKLLESKSFKKNISSESDVYQNKNEKGEILITNQQEIIIKSSSSIDQDNYSLDFTDENVGMALNTIKTCSYGPPGLNPMKHTIKVLDLPKEDCQAEELFPDDNIEDHAPINVNSYGTLDSEVNIDVTNRSILEHINKTSQEKEENVIKKENLLPKPEMPSKNQTSSISKLLQKKLNVYNSKCKINNRSFTSSSDSTVKDTSFSSEEIKNYNDSDFENVNVSEIGNLKSSVVESLDDKKQKYFDPVEFKVNVNPFRNIDKNISVFVDKLVCPVLMVHTKVNSRIQPCYELRDVGFNSHIKFVLKNLSVKKPMMIQSISWHTILRGHSLFMISPPGSGKTLGYLPAICRLISDKDNGITGSVGPTCIVVCATSKSVTHVERLSKMLLGLDEKVLSCYAGIDELSLTTSLLNGCDLFICTPLVLVRLLHSNNFGIDLRRLSTLVLDDCERLSEIYQKEINFFLTKIKEMLKVRANKEQKVQYVISSRIWCDFMEPLAKKAPNSVICIGAFQECVLYSKALTSVNYVKSDRKLSSLFDFLNETDRSKKTVIVCRTDSEVITIEAALTKNKYPVFACNNQMTVHELYKLNLDWTDYKEPVSGPILVCCDGNLNHMNVTDAHYLIHFSLPPLFSMFCKRFSVINDNYPSIFQSKNETIKIKILLEESNAEQLPKILNFIKRCTDELPQFLNDICKIILEEKDKLKAKNLVPICDNLLSIGKCPDFWNCLERHSVVQELDSTHDLIPQSGFVTFQILHFLSAVHYSARLISSTVDGNIKKYPQSYNTLSLKLGMHFSKEVNRKLHGIPEIGDVCAVAIKQNYFVRCQVVKIMNKNEKGNPNTVLIKLIDEEKYETVRDIQLYYLPNELKCIQTFVINVRLANIQPKDKDITFSDLAKEHLKLLLDKEEDIFMRSEICLTIGNCIFVKNVEACQDLSSLNETVVKLCFRSELLSIHGIEYLEHINVLKTLCNDAGVDVINELTEVNSKDSLVSVELPEPRWAHIESDKMSTVFLAHTESPDSFFVRLVKFEQCINILVKDINSFIATNPQPVTNITKGDIVLAKFPDDSTYERARIDGIVNENVVKCFFVDQGDWGEVNICDVVPIKDEFITKMPFQAIECRMVGVRPPGESWNDFCINWFCDTRFEYSSGDLKQLFVKVCCKDKSLYTDGYKYGVVLVDTNGEQDKIINQLMIDLNLAVEEEEELKYFEDVFQKVDSVDECESLSKQTIPFESQPCVKNNDLIFKQPIRSVPLVGSDDDDDFDSDDNDKWSINMSEDFTSRLKTSKEEKTESTDSFSKSLSIENSENKSEKTSSVLSDFEVVTSPNIVLKEIDSDDFSSPESTLLIIKESSAEYQESDKLDQSLKPRVMWYQNKSNIVVKVLLMVDSYDVKITKNSIKFTAAEYDFDLFLYGIVDEEKSSHSNKGQYILIKLIKLIQKNWLTLTRDDRKRKWLVYDVESIDVSSDEENINISDQINIMKKNINFESDSEGDSLCDDVNPKHFD